MPRLKAEVRQLPLSGSQHPELQNGVHHHVREPDVQIDLTALIRGYAFPTIAEQFLSG